MHSCVKGETCLFVVWFRLYMMKLLILLATYRIVWTPTDHVGE